MDQELVQYLDNRFQSLEQRIDQQFGQADQRFAAVDRQFNDVNERIEEAKRHNGILIEDLRYQVQLVAEGFATFVEGRYSEDQARIDERFRETHALIRTSFKHLARQNDHLNQRVENLERKGQG